MQRRGMATPNRESALKRAPPAWLLRRLRPRVAEKCAVAHRRRRIRDRAVSKVSVSSAWCDGELGRVEKCEG
jgi:hypothetical protein